jgi:phosphopantothenoylcysteine decarboxylase/phosphopantothenate--cysteine ligase
VPVPVGLAPRPTGSGEILELEPDPEDQTQVASRKHLEYTRRSTVALCVAGSIAAYKAAEVARGLLEAGVRVIPVMTQAAEEFLGPSTLSGLTGEPVRKTMWDPNFPGEMHVAIARQADAVLIAPATADLISRLAHGRADDLVTALALVSEKPLLIAPAMHPSMWAHPATRRNVAALDADARTEWLGPVDGPVASGDSGLGRMMSPAQIVEATLFRLTSKDLAGLKLVITAGPTAEDLDPVRYLTNRSSGKMGFAMARRAAARGATVTLIAGPSGLPTPHRVKRVDVRSAIAMRGAVWQALGPDLSMADALIMSAAVSDFRPAETHASKQKKKKGESAVHLELTLNPDILAEIGHSRQGPRPMLVGFAVETDSDEKILGYAQGKLADKRVDVVVANRASDSFGRGDNRAMLVSSAGVEALGVLPKETLADRILDRMRLNLLGK